MMRIILLLILLSGTVFGQIANYNQYPTLHNYKSLDDKLDSISFAFSMRQLRTDYVGPILRLRRASDNAQKDFCKGFNDIVDIDSINLWRNGSNVFITIWYDQSGLGRNAVQTNSSFQPRFIPDSARPYFFGDGTDDRLDVLTSIQILTNAGVNGTVSGVIYSTKKSQMSFGSLVGSNRWSAHINWSNDNLYFDPGICCNNPRNFANPNDVWRQYTFIRTTTRTIARRNAVQQFNGTHTNGRCTINNTFGILYANGHNGAYSTCRFSELIMYKYDIASSKYEALEQDQISFWNL